MQVLVVTPPPLFLKVGRKRGGRNSGAVRYKRTAASQLARLVLCRQPDCGSAWQLLSKEDDVPVLDDRASFRQLSRGWLGPC